MRIRLLIFSMLLVATTGLGASDLWIHIRVTERDHRPTNVEVNLPLRMIEKLAPLLDNYESHGSDIHLGGEEMNVEELRSVWARVQNGEVVEEDDAILQLQQDPRGDRLVVRERRFDRGAVVSLPADVIDALLSGPSDRLDLQAAVRTLARYGEGEIVSAQDDGTVVRIWLDQNPEPRD